MYLPEDPYKGLSPQERLKKTHSPNTNVLQDISELITFLGEEKNISKVNDYTLEEDDALSEGNKNTLIYKLYKAEVNDLNETGFKKEDVRFRGFGGVIFIELTPQGKILISGTKPTDEIMREGVNYYLSDEKVTKNPIK